MKVYCSETYCEHWKRQGEGENGICSCDEIEICNGECNTLLEHTFASPEYKENYWKRMKSRKDGHECRLDDVGKRYEMFGLDFFTSADDRWGTDDNWFTEEVSGLRIRGKDINEEMVSKIREKISSLVPVVSLPDSTMDDL